MNANPERGTPDWWVDRLAKRRSDLSTSYLYRKSFYDGTTRLDHLQRWWVELFGAESAGLVNNFVRLVVSVTAERIKPEGFRFGGALGGDARAWETWQRNDMDEFAAEATVHALVHGACPVIVAPPERGESHAVISVEDPGQVVVEYKPGPGRVVAAALKVWDDDVAGKQYATLYLPSATYRYEAEEQSGATAVSGLRPMGGWKPRDGADHYSPNPWGFVPVFEVRNQFGQSHIDDVIPAQLALEKGFVDGLVASEFAAFPQRFLLGVDPVEDDNGNVDEQWKLKVGVERIITLQSGEDGDRPDVKQLAAADLSNYVNWGEHQIQLISARKRIPTHYLLGQSGTFPTGESTRAVETGLVAQANDIMVPMGSGWERIMKCAARMEGDDERADQICEIVWKDPEFRTEGERVDALVKMAALGVPQKVLWQRWGASDEEIRNWDKYAVQDALRMGLANGVDATSGGVTDVAADLPGADGAAAV